MKKLFVALLAVAGLTACFNEEVVRVQDPTAISFEANWVENATRADVAVDPSTTTESLTGFKVWGFMNEVEGKVFEGEEVTGSKGNFTYNNIAYWLPGNTYYFAALAPIGGNWALNTENASKLGAGVVSFTNEDGTEDLLYAANVEEAPALGTAKTVNFTFSHLLSKVKFTFTNGFTNPNMYIDVKNVRIVNAPKAGSINLAVENWWDNDDWKLTQDEVELAFGDACDKTAITDGAQVAANERLTIPASAEYEYEVKFDVVLYMGDVVAYEGTKTSYVQGVALEMGKAYNFTATLNGSNFTEEGEELMPIVFDVEKVNDWVEAGNVTTVLPENISGLTLVTDAVAESTLKLQGSFDGAGHTLSAVKGVDYVIANTARLIETTGNATISNVKIDGCDVKVNDKYGIRGIYTTGTGDVKIENVEIVNCTYSINANNAGKVVVLNSILEGWNSYGSTTTENHFEDVMFVDGDYHNFRPYNNTVCKNCDFAEGVVIDLSCLVEGATVKFIDCTVAGQPLTKLEKNVILTEAPANEALALNVEFVQSVTLDGGNFRTTDDKPVRGLYYTKGGVYNVNNVTVQNVTYALNVSATEPVVLNVSNSTLEGWTSFGDKTDATFNNVKFECGKYANFKPHTSTTLTNCSFEDGFMIDFEEIQDGEVITFKNCTYNGVKLTAANFGTAVKVIDGVYAGKIAF